MPEAALTRERLFGPRTHFVLVPVLSVLAALAVCFLAIALTGRDPVAGYLAMLDGGLGSLRALGESSLKASVLTLTGKSETPSLGSVPPMPTLTRRIRPWARPGGWRS